MGIIGAIIMGFIVGVIAKLITPGQPKPRGFVLTTLVGIVGALLGTLIGQYIGLYQAGEPAGFLGALLGAIVVLMASRQLAIARQ